MCLLSIVRGRSTQYSISAGELQTKLQNIGVTVPCYLFDNNYWYVSHEDWGKIFEDVLLNMPGYTTEKFDCEDFALLVKVRVSERYQLNTIAIIIGDSPWGRHGYNMFLSEAGLFLLEPQTGEVFAIGETGYEQYKPHLAVI